MDRIILFVILSIPVVLISRRTLLNVKSHGFYRFFSWECILWLFVTNYLFWFDDPFTIHQLVSWLFLIISGYLVIVGVLLMKKKGKPGKNRNSKSLYHFEETSELIETGVFKYIRHPLYSSLLFLTWGIFLKKTSLELFIVSLISTLFLYLTAIFEEKECIAFFGNKYVNYKKRTNRFIPFIF